MAGQQKSNMAAQQGTNDNTADTLHKNLQQKVHQKRFTSWDSSSDTLMQLSLSILD